MKEAFVRYYFYGFIDMQSIVKLYLQIVLHLRSLRSPKPTPLKKFELKTIYLSDHKYQVLLPKESKLNLTITSEFDLPGSGDPHSNHPTIFRLMTPGSAFGAR